MRRKHCGEKTQRATQADQVETEATSFPEVRRPKQGRHRQKNHEISGGWKQHVSKSKQGKQKSSNAGQKPAKGKSGKNRSRLAKGIPKGTEGLCTDLQRTMTNYRKTIECVTDR